MDRHDFTALLLVNHKYKVKTKLANKHVVDILNINCIPVFGQPHIQVESNPVNETPRNKRLSSIVIRYFIAHPSL